MLLSGTIPPNGVACPVSISGLLLPDVFRKCINKVPRMFPVCKIIKSLLNGSVPGDNFIDFPIKLLDGSIKIGGILKNTRR
jgi:hypothetical protein